MLNAYLIFRTIDIYGIAVAFSHNAAVGDYSIITGTGGRLRPPES